MKKLSENVKLCTTLLSLSCQLFFLAPLSCVYVSLFFYKFLQEIKGVNMQGREKKFPKLSREDCNIFVLLEI